MKQDFVNISSHVFTIFRTIEADLYFSFEVFRQG